MFMRRILRIDLAVTVVFLSLALLEELTAPQQLRWWWLRLALGTVLVLIRRAAPLTTMVIDIVVLQAWLMPLSVDNYRVWQAICMLIGLHTVGREIILSGPGKDRLLRRAAAITVVAGAVGYLSSQDMAMVSDYFATISDTLGAWISGLLLQFQARRIAERNAAVIEAQESRAREALADERARIARELHDIVAHSVTVMVLQAGAVRRRLAPHQVPEQDLLTGVESAGREAVTELRRTLGLLRRAGDTATAPQPGLSRLDELVDQLREAGLAVTITVDGPPGPLPSSLDLSAYRIIQEALTNVLKHSGAKHAEVTIGYHDDELMLLVTDPGGREAAQTGAGHGLVGMRERAAMFGGRLEAQPKPSGGYQVKAFLPRPRKPEYASGSRP